MIKIDVFATFSFLLFLSICVWKAGIENLSDLSYYYESWGMVFLVLIHIYFFVRLILERRSIKLKLINLVPVFMMTYFPIIASLVFNGRV